MASEASAPVPPADPSSFVFATARERQAAAEAARREARKLADAHYPVDDAVLTECDLVMKGGITSGVVYPLAACELARTHRFRNLGGASAGAIAAVFIAAAEHDRANGGFNRLAELPAELGDRLASLFQPSTDTAPAFAVLEAAIDPAAKGWRRPATVLVAVARHRLAAFLAAVAVVLVPPALALILTDAGWASWLVVTPLVVVALVLGWLAAALAHILRLTRVLPRNAYGLCNGSNGAAAPYPGRTGDEPFMDWMTRRVDQVGGVSDAHHPLTFGDVWGPDADDPDRRVVNLEVMTTNVTFGRPTRIPFEHAGLLFCPEHLAPFLPARIFDHLLLTGPAAVDAHGGPHLCPDHAGTPLRQLPDPADLPVVLAARLSLSCPGLVGALPLHVIDRTASKAGRPVAAWMSDGGISSNFPIHFFDSLLPRRPTFAIDLAGQRVTPSGQTVDFPGGDGGPRPRVWKVESAVSFFSAILDTMRNWADNGQATLPGSWDRVVTIHHTKAEGGINLRMDPDTIALLADKGRLAAIELRGRFDFDRHRWARYLAAMSQLSESVRLARRAWWEATADGGPSFATFVSQYGPTSVQYPRSTYWCDRAGGRTAELVDFADAKDPDFERDPPLPESDLRITARF
jgi:predicted acylesterase/phospholipase RssA